MSIKYRPAQLALVVAVGILFLLPGVHGFWQSAKIDSVISPQKEETEQVENLLANLQGTMKRVNDQTGNLDMALRLQQERLRWPSLMEELAKRSLPGMWLTKITLLADSGGSGDAPPTGKVGGGPAPLPQVELCGIFETKSVEADAQVIDLFCKSLEEGGVLRKMVTVERETPERSADGKTEQVALKFTLRGEWAGIVAGTKTSKDGDKKK